MNLNTNCSSCKNEITIKSNAATRPDLQMEKGDEFLVNCHNCGHFEMKHVNDVRAEPSKLVLISGVILGILVTFFLLVYYGLIGTISVIIPMLIWQQQLQGTKAFNGYMVRRK